ncbi:MAG: class I SAM-dependent methyltransferase [Chthoniobacterales bacterium]|nr:class I SAM-dependent methyltransferase [Chthoniobacterales bacterium]
MSFDRVAPLYRALERLVFGDQLQQARLAFLEKIERPRRVLIVGEGDGRFLAECVRRHPRAMIDCVDASARMIDFARSRSGGPEINFIHADFSTLSLESDQYDLIVAHFFLDCFAGAALCDVVEKLGRAATHDALWLLSDFRIPDFGWSRLWARFCIRTMYLFFGLVSGLGTQRLEDPSPGLRSAGFERVSQRLTRGGMIKSELWRRPA